MYEEEIHFGKLLVKQLEMVLAHLTLTFEPKIKSVPLLPRTDVWTKFEEGRSRCYWLETKRLQTDQLICAKQYALSSSKGGMKTIAYSKQCIAKTPCSILQLESRRVHQVLVVLVGNTICEEAWNTAKNINIKYNY